MESYALLIGATLSAGTVLAIAALGLLINEKAGIVNLGAEGMMLCAAIAGFATVVHTGNTWLGFAAGMAAGAVLAAMSLLPDRGGGPRRVARSVAHEVGPDIQQILEEVDAPWRWYRVHSWDSRAAFVRLNREAAEALGLGLFGAHRGDR